MWNTWRVKIAITIIIVFITIFSTVKNIAISKYLLSEISMFGRTDNQDGDPAGICVIKVPSVWKMSMSKF